MTRDLGVTPGEVHAQATEILRFWFEEATPKQRFAKDGVFDAEIGRRFDALRERVLADGALAWRETPEDLLAAIILLDQFSRNLHRDQAAAFAADTIALELTRHGIEMGVGGSLSGRPPGFPVYAVDAFRGCGGAGG